MAKHSASGVLWSVGLKWAARLGSLVTLAVLTRHLGPEDFGVVAAAAAYVPLLALLAEVGFSAYLVQATTADQRRLSTATWCNLALGVGIAAVTFAVAPLVEDLLGLPGFAPMLQVLSVAVVFSALTGTPAALLRRRLAFRAYAARNLFAAIGSQVLAVTLVLSGAGVWALVSQYVAYSAIACVSVWVAARWRPSLTFSVADARRMVAFGGRVIGGDLVGVLRGWLETMILVSVVGTAGLGYWTIATRLVQVASDLTASTVVFVSSSVFARIKTQQLRVAGGYLRAQSVILSLAGSVMVFLSVASPLLVPLVYGAGWEQSAQLAQVLAIGHVFVLGAMLDRGMFLGTGRPGTWFLCVVGIDLATVAGTALAAPHGLRAVALTFLGVAVGTAVLRAAVVSRAISVPLPVLARRLAGPLAVAFAASLPAWASMEVLPAGTPALVSLCVGGACMVVGCVLLLRLLAGDVLREAWSLAPARVRRRAPRLARWLGVRPARRDPVPGV